MSFTKLKERIDTLPLVLAGPIIRRVEPVGATVWVALRRRRRIRLEIYDGDPPNGQVVAQGARETVAVGANLHIACVTAKPSIPFTAGASYQYDLFFEHLDTTDNISNGGDLFAPQIVAASESEARAKLTYASHGGPARPSFILPPSQLSELRFLHGSCRKISGEHSDALAAADHILREAFKVNGRRPHMLFMTGDSIYNDGCARECFDVVLDAAPILLGWDETMPGPSKKLSAISGVRWDYALDHAGLSNTGPWPSLRHLFGLGETLALYLLTFAELLWPDDLDYQRKTYDFRGTLPDVRRAFANLATYMIFDDHEFSNSWNITAEWVESVLGKPMGRRVYQNSLAAYALCQGWGNTPEQFETGPGREFLKALTEWSLVERAGTASPTGPLERIARHLGLPTEEEFRVGRQWATFHEPDVLRWHYTVPCPGLNIVVLDTYMWRGYPGKFGNSDIIPEHGLQRQLDQTPHPGHDCSLIVVSNVAIELPGIHSGELRVPEWHYGTVRLILWLHPIFLILQILRLLIRIGSLGLVPLPSLFAFIRLLDYGPEHGSKYEHQTGAFERLIARVAHLAPDTVGGKRQSRIVFLSGDVHRSFCTRLTYWSRIPFDFAADPVEAVVAQLVSSPCKWVNPTVVPLKDARVHHWAGWKDQPTLSWLTQPDASPWRFKRSPWMMEYEPGAGQPNMNPEPEWRYSLETITAKSSTQHSPLAIPNRPAPTLEEQFEEMERISPEVLWETEKAHVLKANNLSEVTFDWMPDNRTVTQHVWWRGRPTVDPTWTVRSFVVSMELPAAPPSLPV